MTGFAAHRPRLAILGTIAALALAPAARADIVVAHWGSFLDFEYQIAHMPDLDQRRDLLPNNGSMYCVPTSCMNLTAYLATHGDPSIGPGAADWESPSNYDSLSTSLTIMGLLMLTDPQNGTNGSNGFGGLTNWVAQSDEPYLVMRFTRDGDWAPKLNNIAHQAIQGALVAPCAGWYDTTAYPIVVRNGGHCFTLVTAYRLGTNMYLSINDPASNENPNDLGAQSPYTFETYGVQNETVVPDLIGTVTMSKILGYASGSTASYIDSMYVIYPLFVLSPYEDPNAFSWTFAHLPFGGPDLAQHFTGPAGAVIVDLEMAADAESIFAILDVDGDRGLWNVDPLTNDWTLVDVPVPNGTSIHVSRMRDVYVVDGNDVVCIAVDPEIPVEVARVTPPVGPAAVTSDDATNQVVVVTPITLELYPYDLADDPVELMLPPGVPDLTDGGAISWDPFRNGYWVVAPTENELHFLRAAGAGGLILQTYAHPSLAAPDAIDVDDAGRLYVSTGGTIAEYEITTADELMPVAAPHFEGLRGGPFLQIAKSRTNHDPAQHEGPAWDHRLPDAFGDATPVCAEDVDGDGAIGVGDLVAVILAWGPCPTTEFCAADFDVSGAVDVADLVRVILAWGPCD